MKDNPFADPGLWVAALALLVSLCSALLSWRSLRNSSRALAINERQEKRRQPQLGVYFANGYRRLTGNRQIFGFLVTISNPTDIDNSIFRAELKVTFVAADDMTAVYRIQHNPALAEKPDSIDAQASVLTLPVRIDAHQSMSGWVLFALENDAIGKGTVDDHALVLEDTHGVATETDAIMVREWTDETKDS